MADMIRAATTEDRVIRTVASYFGIAEDHVNRHAKLSEQAGEFDSIEKVELVMELEDEFGFDIDDTDAERLMNGKVDELIDFIAAREVA